MQRLVSVAVVVVGLGLCAGSAQADVQDQPAGASAPAEAASTLHARVGGGLAPVLFRRTDHLPVAHHGVGVFADAFADLAYRLSVGGGVDWERYSYETTTTENYPRGYASFPEERLTYIRLLGMLEWSLLNPGLVNPFVLAVAGMSWERATKTTWQCSPKTASGAVVGGGVGVDVALGLGFTKESGSATNLWRQDSQQKT